MDKREIILQMDSQEYDALRRALLDRDTDPRTEMQKRLDACYRKLVPAQERKRIAKAISRSGALECSLDSNINPDITVFRVIETGVCRCFWTKDSSVDVLEIANRLHHYLNEGKSGEFASLFERQTPITEQKYIDHLMDTLCNFEGTANSFHVDLDRGTFSVLDAASGWWTYPIQDVSDSVCNNPEGRNVSREQRIACFRQMLDGKRISTDDRCLTLRGDRPLRISDVGIQEYERTEDGISTFSLELCTDMETVFGSRIAKDDDSYAVIYASYDISKGTVRKNLDIGLLCELDSEYFLYPMEPEMIDAITQKMDDYCMEQEGLHLAEWAAQEQDSDSLSWEIIT